MRRHHLQPRLLTALALVLALIAAACGGSESAQSVTGVNRDLTFDEVFLEPANDVGVDPFLTDATVTEPPSAETLQRGSTTGLTTDDGIVTVTGDRDNLYGTNPNKPACDPEQLITHLTNNPNQAKAWATTQNINPDDIPDYIRTLTPVVLTADTLVTNHGYTNNTFKPRTSILQAGTAVLIDNQGTPRTRCACGNPLTPPTNTPTNPNDIQTTGTPWGTYNPTNIITITPTNQPLNQLTTLNTTNGNPTNINLNTKPDGPYPVGSALEELCSSPCEITGRAEVEHPSWGDVDVATYRQVDESGRRGGVVAVDGDDVILWHVVLDEAAGTMLGMVGSTDIGSEQSSLAGPVDAVGHVFVEWNPGRYDSVSVLRPTVDGFEDFGSLPDPDDYNGRFYFSVAVDDDGDGIYEIDNYSNDCDPSCAGGTTTFERYVWDGTGYSVQPTEEAVPVDQLSFGFIGEGEACALVMAQLGELAPGNEISRALDQLPFSDDPGRYNTAGSSASLVSTNGDLLLNDFKSMRAWLISPDGSFTELSSEMLSLIFGETFQNAKHWGETFYSAGIFPKRSGGYACEETGSIVGAGA